ICGDCRITASKLQDILNTSETLRHYQTMKQSILKLYRSAKETSNDWVDDVSGLPDQGLVIWGDQDPFISVESARRFCQSQRFPLHIEHGAGHWAVCERPRQLAVRLTDHWHGLGET
ncbi:alpha/beta fold hydrolase, partial [Shimia thalassica]|uniref:alpha/beta fold hydrolase n=1 Tax=Shimia thalassica TaxID=1715693 RepID=UPI0026E362C1